MVITQTAFKKKKKSLNTVALDSSPAKKTNFAEPGSVVIFLKFKFNHFNTNRICKENFERE